MANEIQQTSSTTREFTLEFLQKITDNFSEEHIIGSGGYGVVYKGVLENGEQIALKKLHHTPGLDDTQFRNEFNHLMRAQHPNITRLVGYCYNIGHQRIRYGGEHIFALVEERVLCFEYLQGGSLDKKISAQSCGLDWRTCFKIIKGVCEGLNYLHNGCTNSIYHLDLKPANILLDENMIPKIGDFGLSRLFPSTQTYVTTKVIGTPGYMPPEYIERCEITSKYDVFSLGVIIVRIIAGDEGYSKCAHMSSQEFLEHVHDNWGQRLQARMSLNTSKQVKTCMEIALRCVEVDRDKRPTIAEIVNELNTVDTAKNSLTGQVPKNQNWNSERRGRIVFSTTCRPPVPFDIFSCPFWPLSSKEELHVTDGVSNNYNGRHIPLAALKALLKRPKLADEGGITDANVDAGHVSGLVFVSERDDCLETLYIALHFNPDSQVKVFSLADIFGAADFSGTRMEDSGCMGGGYSVGSRTVDHCLIYVSTKEGVQEGRTPWTVVYKTNLTSGKNERLTPKGAFDLSPAVSPSGKTVAVASFESKRWNEETANLKTDIYVMNVDSEYQGLGRKLLIKNGGWPSWGSDNIIFFHRGMDKIETSSIIETTWGVFCYNISTGVTVRVTPEELDAVTPAAINETQVAVAAISQKSKFAGTQQYRHIEIFDTNTPGLPPVQVTHLMSESDHYNPFVLDGRGRIGYHRCRSDLALDRRLPQTDILVDLQKLDSPVKDVGLFRLSSMSPAISMDGSRIAYASSDSSMVLVADNLGARVVYNHRGPEKVFSPVWNLSPDKDILYFCIGTSFNGHIPLEIYAISNASGHGTQIQVQRLTYGGFNNAFPSSSPDGNRFVFRSTRDFISGQGNSQPTTSSWWKFKSRAGAGSPRGTRNVMKDHKNLYIMVNTEAATEEGWVTRLTKGEWTDTHCQWSPNGDWIVFSSTRGKPRDATQQDNELLLKYCSVYLVKVGDPTVVIRVMNGEGDLGSHMSHPVFSPDGRSIAVMAAFATVSVDPISLPMFNIASQVYNDIFMVDIDPDDKTQNEHMIKGFRRITHSRFDCGTPAWTTGPNKKRNMLMQMELIYKQRTMLHRSLAMPLHRHLVQKN